MLIFPSLRAQDTTIVIERIYISQHPQAPGYPQFVIHSKSSNFQMGFGGYVKLTGVFDFKGIVDNYDFITYDIPMEPAKLDEKRIYLDAHQSRLYTEILGKIKSKPMRAYVEFDFYSDHYYPRLRHAYIQYQGFLLGQTWSTLMDLDATPNTVDFEGPNSEVALRTPMIRYSFKISKSFSMQTALELPDASLTYGSSLVSSHQYVPDIIANIKFHGKWGHLQLGGVLRTLTYGDTLSEKVKSIPGYGGILSGTINIGKKDNFMFQAVAGRGISNYIQDISGVGLDAIANFDYGQDPVMKGVLSGGIYFAFQHFWHPKWNSTAVYGYTRVNTELLNSINSPYRLGQYATVNLFWNVVAPLNVAIEYLWGQRRDFDKEKGNANRINAMVQFVF